MGCAIQLSEPVRASSGPGRLDRGTARPGNTSTPGVACLACGRAQLASCRPRHVARAAAAITTPASRSGPERAWLGGERCRGGGQVRMVLSAAGPGRAAAAPPSSPSPGYTSSSPPRVLLAAAPRPHPLAAGRQRPPAAGLVALGLPSWNALRRGSPRRGRAGVDSRGGVARRGRASRRGRGSRCRGTPCP